MIRNFKHKGLRHLFETRKRKRVPPDLARRISSLLDWLAAAAEVRDLNMPGFGLHELKGDRTGTWAIKVNKNWRITFRFAAGEAYDVDLEDYH